MRKIPLIALCAALPLLSACADPEGNYPQLMPTDQILAEPVIAPAPSGSAATATAEALRTRAKKLQQPVIEPGIRQRMHDAVEE